MKPGDMIYTTNIQSMFPGNNSIFYYKADREKHFVFILVGQEPRDGSDPLDVIEKFREWGWEKTVEQKE